MMKLKELSVNQDYVLEDVGCELLMEEPVAYENGTVELGEGSAFVFVTAGKRYSFHMIDPVQHRRAENLLRRGLPCLAEKRASNNLKIFFLRLVFFSQKERLGTLDVVLSERILEQIKKKKKNVSTLSDISSSFSLKIGAGSFFAYSIQDYRPASVSPESAPDEGEDADDGDDAEKLEGQEKQRALRLYGSDFMIFARLIGEDMDAYLAADKVQFSFANLPCMQLAEGTLRFTSHREFTSVKIREALRSSPGYIQLWDQYSDKEGEFLLRRAREIGIVQLNRSAAAVEGNNIAVPAESGSREALQWIQEGDYLSFSEETPPYLADETLSWQAWKESGFSAAPPETEAKDSAERPQIRPARCKVVRKRDGVLVLEGQAVPRGMASLSIEGDKVRISRREDARNAIRNGQCANPLLGCIIEGIPYMDKTKKQNGKHYDPLSPLVLDKIFSHKPTQTQRRAIEIALNTPDIAIIQGPPGTGKTTVITAIIERLNELADKSNGVRGEVLVTSLQHDAVINIQERLKINSLPTIKFGRSSKQEQEEDFDLATENWCMDRAQKLREKHLSLRRSDGEAELQRLRDLYLRSPNNQNALELLRCASAVNTSSELEKDIRCLMQGLSIQAQENTDYLENAIRRLRTTKAAFEDDGAENAMQLYDILADILGRENGRNEEILRTLRSAATAAEPDPQLLESLREVREELLGRCIPMPFYRRESPRTDIIEICKQVQQAVRSPENETDRILASYLAQLEYNMASVRESLKNYCFVFTSTLQQSEGREIRMAKGVKYRSESVEYDTVIVDEAARANPGDLMIPLAQARSRIILVGDHRQLPHMYDEDIFEELQSRGDVKNETDIKISMFQHLLENAKKLEKADGIPRSITLDAQYRMHPELGNFVSRLFYKEHQEEFASPLPAESFAQPISDYPVLWLNFRRERGSECRSPSKSRYRICEAVEIVRRIDSYLADPACDGLTFGVISFYSAQVQEIRRLMDRGNQRIAEALRTGRVRVGSVDSFQGMEFDVIFLSVVRSGSRFQDVDFDELERDVRGLSTENEARLRHEAYVEEIGRKNYGFLTSPNRLCVALSRQKRLLIVVGDQAMFCGGNAGRTAAQCVPAMAALRQMCLENGTVIECGE